MSAIRQQIMQMAAGDPSVAQASQVVEAKLANVDIQPEELTEIIQVLEFVLQNPDKYPAVREAAIRDGLIDANLVPEQFSATLIVSLLIALYLMQDKLAQPERMARGGLAKIAHAGRGGDSQLMRVDAKEKEMLRRMGGAGSVNPNTGLKEYKGGIIGTIASVAVPVLSIVAPVIGTAIGGALTGGMLGGVGSAIVGNAVLGAAGSALSGGNIGQGALLGGLGGGLGNVVGGAANKTLGLGLGETGQALLGSGLVGAGAGALTGQGAGKGALMGVAGGALGQLAGTAGTGTALGTGVSAAGQAAGNMLTAGYDPKTAALGGGLAGIAGGLKFKPSETAVDNLQAIGKPYEFTPTSEPGAVQYDANGNIIGSTPYMQEFASPGSVGTEGGYTNRYGVNVGGKLEYQAQPTDYTSSLKLTGSAAPYAEIQSAAPQEKSLLQKIGLTSSEPAAAATTGQAAAKTGSNLMAKIGTGALLYGTLAGNQQPTPEQQQAVSTLSPSQQEYFNRPSLVWDWDKIQQDASAAGMDLGNYMAKNWNNFTAGQYNVATAAKGGALSQVARYAKGAGTGRSDSIEARLSDGEYVIDAETVAMLGDGSSEAGARVLDRMREEIRKQKGKALAKGKISPNAKSPLTYIKGIA